MTQVQLYDTTLRDGAQREGISFTVEDKLRIAKKLDELGIHFIEGGWPGSNPKDEEFFTKAPSLALSHALLVAFGSTRHPKAKAEKDPNLHALLDAKTEVVTIVGKSWDIHVTQVLETTLEQNLRMIADSISYLKSQGRRVFFDAEHFFDGYKANAPYALESLKAAAEAGAECLILCDTNGGAMTGDVAAAFGAARKVTGTPLGVHTHNDAELAVANTLTAVQAGATQVQGTINGYGERCGNANLCSVIPALKLKMDIDCISDEQLARLSEVAHYVSEVANMTLDTHLPYVGASAFAHKGGLHVAAMMKWEKSYHHIEPDLVGNQWRTLVSELSGKGGIIRKAREQGLELISQGEQARDILEHVKTMESRGFQYEDAEASFELLVRRAQPDYKPPFELIDFMVVVEKRRRPSVTESDEELLSEATVKIKVGGDVIHTAAEGNGPVDALDAAMRKSLVVFYPRLEAVRLVDYKVRVIEGTGGTGARVRVLIESSDGEQEWRTVGSSSNIIEASWLALADSLEYWLLKKGATPL
ncbi:MAG: citramalate synthase [Dehalococcoidia bacterium]|nr:citramalate synthase [Dehalococcoidia bacterium]